MSKTNGVVASASAGAADGVLMPAAEAVPGWSGALLQAPDLNYEAWTEALRPIGGRYTANAFAPDAFAAKMRARSVCGFLGLDLRSNAGRVERTQRDARLDGMEHYYLAFQVVGGTTINQKDQVVELTPGDVALVDAARPVICTHEHKLRQWFTLELPRQSLVSHLGLEPQYGQRGRRNTRAGRVLFELVRDAIDDEESGAAPDANYMRLAIYDLVGALFSKPDPMSVSLPTDRLFTRLCNIIRDRFADPGLNPSEVATEAGISLRYLQKLFTMRNSTCTQFINSVRLDYAASLLQRRAFLNKDQPISEIAYASGFGDYPHFAKKFRHRFGRAPSVHAKCRD